MSRETQDQFAALSHKKAAEAIKAGKFRDEIVPVTVTVEDDKGNSKTITVSQGNHPSPIPLDVRSCSPLGVLADEGVRADTTAEKLGKLRPVFKEGGSTTAGNSSQVSDGAAACIVTKRSVAQKLGLPIFGVFRSFAAVGVEPAVMGIGPAVAIPAAVQKAGISLQDVDVYEINEAFASQAAEAGHPRREGQPQRRRDCPRPPPRLHRRQADCHPPQRAQAPQRVRTTGLLLDCTLLERSADQYLVLPHFFFHTRSRFGVVSMCIGSGMGAAAVYEREN